MLQSLRLLTPGPWDAGSCLLSQAADLQVQVTREPQKKPAPSQPLLFGKTFTDHMLMVEWTGKAGWGPPRIQPFQNLTLHPACSALHYSLQVGWLPPGPVRVPPSPQPSLPTLLLSASRLTGVTSLKALCLSAPVCLSPLPETACVLGHKQVDSRLSRGADLALLEFHTLKESGVLLVTMRT